MSRTFHRRQCFLHTLKGTPSLANLPIRDIPSVSPLPRNGFHVPVSLELTYKTYEHSSRLGIAIRSWTAPFARPRYRLGRIVSIKTYNFSTIGRITFFLRLQGNCNIIRAIGTKDAEMFGGR